MNWREKLKTETRTFHRKVEEQIQTKTYHKVKMLADAFRAIHATFENVQLIQDPNVRIDVQLEGKRIAINPLNLYVELVENKDGDPPVQYYIEGSLFQISVLARREISTVEDLMEELIKEIKHFVIFE